MGEYGMVSVPRELLQTIRSFHWTQQDSSDLARAKARAALIDLLAQPAEQRQERCNTCHGLGEVATGTVTHHGYNQPPEPDLDVCPECSGEQRWYVAGDIDRLVRELDVLLNGDGAALQARLCDLVAQVATSKKHQGEPVALPERRDENQGDSFRRGTAHGFNACLVTVAKLGPLYTHPAPAVQGEPFAVFSIDNTGYRVRVIDHTSLPPDGTKLYTRPAPTIQQEPVACASVYVRWMGGKLAATVQRFDSNQLPVGCLVDLYKYPVSADPGEVERLRADVETMRNKNNEYWHETEALRTQLAERDALLRELVGLMYKGEPFPPYSPAESNLQTRLRDALERKP